MAWKKAPPELIERFDAAFPKTTGAERRLMFGFPAGFMNGNLFGGIFEDRIMVRLSGDAVKGLKGARPFEPMPDRAMTGYTELPAPIIADARSLRTWLDRAATVTAAFPPKPTKKDAPAARTAVRRATATTKTATKPTTKKPRSTKG